MSVCRHELGGSTPTPPAIPTLRVCCMCVCSGLILIGFYGNERANKGLERSVNAAADMIDTVTLIRNQV